MSLSERKLLLDLDRDVPTTAADVEALRKARAIPTEEPWVVVQRLIDALPPDARRQSRETSDGWQDFEI